MNARFAVPLLSTLGIVLAAQSAPAPAEPSFKWHAGLWASAAASDRETTDGSLFLRTVDAGEGQLALDGLQLGAEANLTAGWSLKFTGLAGRDAKVLNMADGESGSFSYPEAMLVWTGGKDTLKLGRMWTGMGMEVMDQTQDIMATRGLLFTYAIPFNQVGIDWHHAFTPSWSTDAYLFNGEDRVQDNNRSKTAGLALTYNHGGASDKYLSLMVYRGAEQDGFGATANQGAEGRHRERVSAVGQWVWGASTLQWEIEYGREPFPAAVIQGATGGADVKASWSAAGAIYKHQFDDRWAILARADYLKDDTGERLSYDTTVAAAYGTMLNADLAATSVGLGLERKWGATFTRFEMRRDQLNKDVLEQGMKGFRDATSATWSFGTSF